MLALLCVLPLEITTASVLPPVIRGQPYSQTLTATGGVPPYEWSKLPGTPYWLVLSPSGVLSAEMPPNIFTEFTFALKVKDFSGEKTKTFSLTVK